MLITLIPRNQLHEVQCIQILCSRNFIGRILYKSNTNPIKNMYVYTFDYEVFHAVR